MLHETPLAMTTTNSYFAVVLSELYNYYTSSIELSFLEYIPGSASAPILLHEPMPKEVCDFVDLYSYCTYFLSTLSFNNTKQSTQSHFSFLF